MDFLKRRFYKIIIHLKATLQYHNVGKILLFFQHYLHLFICCKIKFFTGWFYYRIKYFLQNDLFTECIFFSKWIFFKGERNVCFSYKLKISLFSHFVCTPDQYTFALVSYPLPSLTKKVPWRLWIFEWKIGEWKQRNNYFF